MNLNIKAYVTGHIGEKETPDFLEWAFGPLQGTTPISQFPALWNHLHGSEYTVSGSEKMRSSLDRMIAIWRKLPVKPDRTPVPPYIPSDANTDVRPGSIVEAPSPVDNLEWRANVAVFAIFAVTVGVLWLAFQ